MVWTKEERAAYNKQYKIDNKEKIAAKAKQHTIDNKEEIAAWHRQNYINNKEQIKEQQKQAMLNNPKKISAQRKQRRIKHREKITINQWIRKGVKCDNFPALYKLVQETTHCNRCNVLLTTGTPVPTPARKVMDHDHETGLFRNVLCVACNNKRR